MTALHFVNFNPKFLYSLSLLSNPSRPFVTVSSLLLKGSNPSSTFIPGIIPFLARCLGKGTPSSVICQTVSLYIMTPLINSSIPGVAKSISRYLRFNSGVEVSPASANLLEIVFVLSSAARSPFLSARRILYLVL